MTIPVATAVELATAIFGTGGFSAMFTWLSTRRQEHGAAVKALEADIDQHRAQLQKAMNQVHALNERIATLESASDSGFPSWRKNVDGRYFWVNSEYVRTILAPLQMTPDDLYGKTDLEVPRFSHALAVALKTLDLTASVYGYACASHVQFHANTKRMTVIKKSAVDAQGRMTLIGFACPEYTVSDSGVIPVPT